jgi:hypothetical protein
MFWFGTPGGDNFPSDYIGSVACFDSNDTMIAISKINPLEIEQDNFEPLTLAELATMVGTGNINPTRFKEWKGAPALWNCWTILIDHPDPSILMNFIASCYQQLLTLEKFTYGDPAVDEQKVDVDLDDDEDQAEARTL